MTNRCLACLSLAATLAVTALPASPALADGAASTRNIIGGAAAVAGALIIINHNRKVHQKYADYDRRQARTQAEASNAEAAYQSERSAYAHEAALVSSYRHEVAIQHQEVLRLRHQLALANRNDSQRVATGLTQTTFHPLVAAARSQGSERPTRVANVSYGWGAF